MSELTVTKSASEKIKEILEEEFDKTLKLRIYIVGGGCSGFSYGFSLDSSVNDDDLVFEDNGAPIVVDSMSLMYLAGSKVDYDSGIMGSQFKIDNPNATTTCGCGSSFSI